jgi:Ca2+-binding EF-hand superfamily protein
VVADNGDGELNFKELKRMCEDLGLPLEDSEEEELGKKDKDGSGTLDLDEVMCWWLQRVGCLPNPAKQQEALARNTFRKFDNDGSGSLDVGEMKKLFVALGAKFSDKEMEEVMQQLDSSGDGMIDEEEFIEWWTNRALNNRRGGGLLALKLRKLATKAQQLFSTDIFTAAWQGDLELLKLFISTEIKRLDGSQDEEVEKKDKDEEEPSSPQPAGEGSTVFSDLKTQDLGDEAPAEEVEINEEPAAEEEDGIEEATGKFA